MKKPKRPSLKKMPKAPKTNAQKTSWDNWEQRAKAVKTENEKKLKVFQSEAKQYENEMTRRKKLKEKYRK